MGVAVPGIQFEQLEICSSHSKMESSSHVSEMANNPWLGLVSNSSQFIYPRQKAFIICIKDPELDQWSKNINWIGGAKNIIVALGKTCN